MSPVARHKIIRLFGWLFPAGLIVVPLALFGGTLLGTPMWLDEQITRMIVTDPDVGHSIRAVVHGVDTNPPVYHLLLRVFYDVIGGTPEVTLRLFSVLTIYAGLVATFWTLRRTLSGMASFIGVLAVWVQPVVLQEAFEARFYAPMLALAAAVCWAMGGSKRTRWIGLPIFCALLCSIHYFGIFSVLAVMFFEILAGRETIRQRALRCLPALGGVLVFLLCIPLARMQRQGLSIPTWMEPESLIDQISTILHGVVGSLAPLAILLAAGVGSYAWARLRKRPQPGLNPRWDPGIRALFSQSLVPVMVLLFSVVVQPAYYSRYAIAGVLAVAPIGAWAAARLRPVLGVAAVVLFLGFTLSLQHELADTLQASADKFGRVLDGINQMPPHAPVVFASRHEAYVLPRIQPELAGRSWLFLPPADAPNLQLMRRYEIDMARKTREFYPKPELIDADGLKRLNGYVLIYYRPDLGSLLPYLDPQHVAMIIVASNESEDQNRRPPNSSGRAVALNVTGFPPLSPP